MKWWTMKDYTRPMTAFLTRVSQKYSEKKESAFQSPSFLTTKDFFITILRLTLTPLLAGFFPAIFSTPWPRMAMVKVQGKPDAGFWPAIEPVNLRTRSEVERVWARVICSTSDATTMRPLDKRGQNLLEYAIIVAAVGAVMVAMSIYVFRSIQSTQQVIQEEFQR